MSESCGQDSVLDLPLHLNLGIGSGRFYKATVNDLTMKADPRMLFCDVPPGSAFNGWNPVFLCSK